MSKSKLVEINDETRALAEYVRELFSYEERLKIWKKLGKFNGRTVQKVISMFFIMLMSKYDKMPENPVEDADFEPELEDFLLAVHHFYRYVRPKNYDDIDKSDEEMIERLKNGFGKEPDRLHPLIKKWAYRCALAALSAAAILLLFALLQKI